MLIPGAIVAELQRQLDERGAGNTERDGRHDTEPHLGGKANITPVHEVAALHTNSSSPSRHDASFPSSAQAEVHSHGLKLVSDLTRAEL